MAKINETTGNTRINVAGAAALSSSNGFDVLHKLPNITVSGNSISILGRSGVNVHVNGKPLNLAGSDLVRYLENLPGNQIMYIDILTAVSAKHDASGSAGIIDIKLKKDDRYGLNGSATAGLGQGRYGRQNSGINMNYRNKQINLYSNFNYQSVRPFNNLVSNKVFGNGMAVEQDNYIRRRNNVSNGRIGIDLYAGKHVIGILYSKNYAYNQRTTFNNTLYKDLNASVTKITTDAFGREITNNDQIDVNAKLQMGRGEELFVDAEYARFLTDWNVDYSTSFKNLSGAQTRAPYLFLTDQGSLMKIKAFKLDYVKKIKTMRFEGGFKLSTINNDSRLSFINKSNVPVKLDSARSGQFDYTERNSAVYLQFSGTHKQSQWQVGMRVERTSLNIGEANKYKDSSYYAVFPSMSYVKQLSKSKTFSIVLNRRIDRPILRDLLPLRNYSDLTFYSMGMPRLKSTLTWVGQFTYSTPKSSIGFVFSPAKNRTVILALPESDTSITIVEQPVNVDQFINTSFNATQKITFSKSWTTQGSGAIILNFFKGLSNRPDFSSAQFTFNFTVNNNFKISSATSAELLYTFNSSSSNGFVKQLSQHLLTIALATKITNRMATRFSLTDVFSQQWPRVQSGYVSYTDMWFVKRDTRLFSVNLTYSFGSNKIAGARNRVTSADEEKRRSN